MKTGGQVARVGPGGLAERIGVQVGDRVVAVNGAPVRDVLDVLYHSANERVVTIEVERSGHRFIASGTYDGNLGLEFEEWTFDGIRRCRNRCLFCFVDQLPPGMRESLYIKDDDYRYSVLCGNFVTLTNLTARDWTRLEEQRPGPLRVSVHSTDLELRRRLLGNPKAPDVLGQLKRLARQRIPVHCQVVLMPGINDGDHLDRTVADLVELYPTVQSIAVVPVGRTKYSERALPELRGFTVAEAAELVKKVEAWQRDCQKRFGVGLVYLADEFYLRAGRQVPAASKYDGFPQYENGVGMVRVLLDDWYATRKKLTTPLGSRCRRVTVACGTAIASVLGEILGQLAEVGGPKANLVAVDNVFFGSSVTVSGLLTAGDVVNALRGRDLGDLVVLPRAMLDSQGKLTLDDESPRYIEEKLEVPVKFATTASEMLSVVREFH